MKTTIAISAVLVAALAACADKQPPRSPSTDTNTTTTTSFQQPAQRPTVAQESSSSLYDQQNAGAPATIGVGATDYNAENSATATGTVKNTPLAPPPEPALNAPEASARPAKPQPGPANAKALDGKSPNAAAATDSGNSKSEVQMASSIRKRMVASKTLSFGAKNAKVITAGTKVTLRGNVKTDAERSEIEGIAKNTDGITDVDNQLVVKP